MQSLPVLSGSLGQWHEMGDDVLHVHLEAASDSHHQSTVMAVTTFTREVVLTQHCARSYDDAWRPAT